MPEYKPEDLLKSGTARRLLGFEVNPSTFYRWMVAGTVPSVMVGKHRRVPRQWVEEEREKIRTGQSCTLKAY